MEAPTGPTFMIFDTETTGKNPRTARMTQLAFLVTNLDGYVIDEFQSLVKPDGWEVPKEQFFIENNMSTERCEKEGHPAHMVLRRFQDALKGVTYKVAHNISYDNQIVMNEMIRYQITKELFQFKKQICTMRSSTNVCKIISSRGGYKWPKLEELHRYLFSEDFADAHDAGADVRATGKCLIELINREHIKLH